MKVNTTLYLVAAALSFAIVALRASHEAWLRVYPVAHFTGVILRILPLPIFPPIKRSVMGLKASLKTFTSPIGALHTLFKASSICTQTSWYDGPSHSGSLMSGWERKQYWKAWHTHTHTCADIQTQRKMSITFLWAIFYCWWTAIGFMASNHEWCSAFSLCFLLALYSLYISVSLSLLLRSPALHLCYSHFNFQ